MTEPTPRPASIADLLAAVAEQLPPDDPAKCAQTLAAMTTPAERAAAEQAAPDTALPPTLAALRDLIAADPGAMTITEAEESARTLLAAHAHELAGLVQNAILADRDRAPGGGALGPRNHARRGGMLTARQVLDRYADQLDQTAGGEQA